jgi:hypothetical protein
MERFKDARAVLDYLYRLQITHIRANGRNERDEFGAVQSALSQLIFKDELRETLKDNPALGFTISDELEAIYGDYLQLTQHADRLLGRVVRHLLRSGRDRSGSGRCPRERYRSSIACNDRLAITAFRPGAARKPMIRIVWPFGTVLRACEPLAARGGARG